jgi:ribonucleoside-diphosphate reductase alpha chain
VLKNNAGTDDNRVRKLDYTIGLSKLFYDRVIKNEDITLFSPHSVPYLMDAWGTSKFDSIYLECENDKKIRQKKKISARKLFSLIVKERVETGRIYVLNVDSANEHGAWLDKVTMSNLCTEVIHPTTPLRDFNDPDAEIGMCILSAINMLEIKDWKDLEKTCDLAVRFLDEIIDIQVYFNKAAENFAKKRRSLGIGLTNLAAYFAKHDLSYNNRNTLSVLDEYAEHFQYYLLKASLNLAKEKGSCEKFSHTKYSKGILPIDTYKKNVDEICKRKLSLEWNELRKEIVKTGLRHSTVSCCMPCESSSVIQCSTNGIEPVRSLITFKTSKTGKLPVLVPGIGKYESNYELCYNFKDNTGIINVNSIIQKYIDMAISTNVYYNYSHYENNILPDSKVMKELLYAFSMGLISLYYNNTDDGDKEQVLDKQDSDCSSGACKL